MPQSGLPGPRIGPFADHLQALGTPQRAVGEKAYLKSSLEHFGVPMPLIRSTTRQWWRAQAAEGSLAGESEYAALIATANGLWQEPVHELKMASIELLRYRPKLLGIEDLQGAEHRLRTSYTWAFVDPLATDVVSQIVQRHPSQAETGSTLDRWASDPDFWIRRAAMLSQLPIVKRPDGDASRFLGYADSMLEEKEFFIRKAIGWVLRDIGRKRPELVFDWALPRVQRMSGVTFRETIKYLGPEQQSTLRASWKT